MEGLRTFNPFQNSENNSLFIPDTPRDVKKRLDYIGYQFAENPPLSKKKIESFFDVTIQKLQVSKGQLFTIYSAESALSKERYDAEFDRLIFQLKHFSSFVKTSPNTESVEEGNLGGFIVPYIKKTYPIGPILVMGSSNFPLAYSTLGGDTVSAFAAQCPVIVKAHPFHLGTSSFVASIVEEVIEEVGLPDWFFTHIIDYKDHRNTDLIVQHPALKGIGFTGSQRIGKLILEKVRERVNDPIPVFAEMGSINPVVLGEKLSIDSIEGISKKMVTAVNTDAGQFCTKPGVIFLPNTNAGQKFLSSFHESWKKEPHYFMLHPTIEMNYQERIKKWRNNYPNNALASIEGSKINHGQKISFCFSAIQVMKENIEFEEVFGPCTFFVLYDQMEEVYSILKRMEGQLTGSFFGKVFDEKLLQIFEKMCGRVIHNDVPTGVNVLKSMNHGGPFPASSDVRFTAVGMDSVKRFQKAVTLQNF